MQSSCTIWEPEALDLIIKSGGGRQLEEAACELAENQDGWRVITVQHVRGGAASFVSRSHLRIKRMGGFCNAPSRNALPCGGSSPRSYRPQTQQCGTAPAHSCPVATTPITGHPKFANSR